jgi:TRAP-type mannitol/chloroaromatic compound transport system permease small subunit
MTNPYEPPQDTRQQVSTENHRPKSVRTRGIVYLLGGPIFFVSLYFALQFWMHSIAKSEPAPNQGSMLIAFFILAVGGIGGAIMLIRGIVIVVLDLSR